jgi:hypothetical protein
MPDLDLSSASTRLAFVYAPPVPSANFRDINSVLRYLPRILPHCYDCSVAATGTEDPGWHLIHLGRICKCPRTFSPAGGDWFCDACAKAHGDDIRAQVDVRVMNANNHSRLVGRQLDFQIAPWLDPRNEDHNRCRCWRTYAQIEASYPAWAIRSVGIGRLIWIERFMRGKIR